MKISKKGIELIKQFEGFSAKPYPDPGTGAKPYTIGYGSTFYEDGSSVSMNDPSITEERAVELLEFEVNNKTKILNKLIKVSVNQNQFDALCSLCYNIGEGNLSKSTLIKLLNSNADRVSVADQFLRWNKAAGKVLSGLTRRRQAERSLFLQDPLSEEKLSAPSEEDINSKLKSIEDEILKK